MVYATVIKVNKKQPNAFLKGEDGKQYECENIDTVWSLSKGQKVLIQNSKKIGEVNLALKIKI